MTDIGNKTIEFGLKASLADVVATMKIDCTGGITAFSCKISSEDGPLTPEDLHFTVDECVKTAMGEGYLPKSKQTTLKEGS